ncbi:MAG: hypothetical protein NC299_08095 [Lachnospiraceae bacterium]|nr:hypothetical protein [Ruminococcus sp.]MCM1275313.1 hypothetical protein [Lachnospiraceae bacterium]
MKTVLTDNSLCAYTLYDEASPEYIYKYIRSLAEAGVRYVELDFRALMKLRELPRGIGYVFRLVDPMFLRLAELFDFDYMLVTFADVHKKIKSSVPMMLELPVIDKYSRRVLQYAESELDGKVTAVRIRGSHPFAEYGKVLGYVNELKNEFPVPLDFCPMNDNKTALDSAMKFTAAGADSVTLTMGVTERYCSLEEYLFTLMSMYGSLPGNLKLSPLCAATVYHRNIFRNRSGDGIIRYMDILDHDIHFLTNADTGERVRMRMSLKDTEYLQKTFVSALERMAREEDIPDDVFEDITDAMRHYEPDFYNSELLGRRRRGLLN